MKKVNIILLCLNIGLTLSFVSLWLLPSCMEYGYDKKCAKQFGMKPYAKRHPFTILVTEDFPKGGGFMIGVEGLPLMFKCTGLDGEVINAKMCIGTKHELDVAFTVKPKVQLLESILINDDEYFKDMGADGSYDKRMSLSVKSKR
ncbi:hypothetical protein ACFLQR_03080 [Verrucomicrobiota bacterium]